MEDLDGNAINILPSGYILLEKLPRISSQDKLIEE